MQIIRPSRRRASYSIKRPPNIAPRWNPSHEIQGDPRIKLTQSSSQFGDNSIMPSLLKVSSQMLTRFILITIQINLRQFGSQSDLTAPYWAFVSCWKANKSIGVDQIIVKNIQYIVNIFLMNLSLWFLISTYIETSSSPRILKIAEVVAILKVGINKQATNYRFISLISNIAHIFKNNIHRVNKYHKQTCLSIKNAILILQKCRASSGRI